MEQIPRKVLGQGLYHIIIMLSIFTEDFVILY